MIFGSNLVENDGWMAFLDLSFKVFPGEGTPGFVFGFQAFSFCGKASIVLNITLTFVKVKGFNSMQLAQYLTADKITWCQKKLTLAPKNKTETYKVYHQEKPDVSSPIFSEVFCPWRQQGLGY